MTTETTMPATVTDRLNGLTTSVAVKPPCVAATSGPILLSGLQIVGGVAVVAGDRVLVKDQADTRANGIYIASTSAWQRSEDFDGQRDVVNGTIVIVVSASGLGSQYRVVAVDPVVIGTSSITFVLSAFAVVDSSNVNFLQAGSGAVLRTMQSKMREEFSVTDFGAVGDGVTNDGAAIAAAAAAASTRALGSDLANTRRAVLRFPGNYTFSSSTGVNVGENVDVLMESPLIITGAASATILGMAIGGNNFTHHGRYVLDVRRATQSNWSTANDVGIVLKNIGASNIEIRRSQGFCVGAQCLGSSNGFALNRVTIGEIRGARFGLQLTNLGTGFVNGNNFYGGEFAVAAGEGVNGQSRYGVYITGVNGNNSNQFYGQSFELGLVNAQIGNPAAEAIPFLIDNADSSWNTGYSIRSEGNSGTLLKVTADAYRNFFHSAYVRRIGAYPNLDSAGLIDTSKFKLNNVTSYFDELMARSYEVFDSGDLGKRINQYDGANAYTVDGFDAANSVFALSPAQVGVSRGDDNMLVFSTTCSLVRFLDTRVNKRFMVFFDTGDITSPTDFAVKPFAADGSLLADNPTPAHVYGEDLNVFTWNAGVFGGSYFANGEGPYRQMFFVVDDLTKRAAFLYVAFAGYTLKSLRIFALDAPCSSLMLTREREFEGLMIATAQPNALNWKQGDRCYNHTPAAAGTEGWVCTTSGTFGALAGVTANTTAGSASITVNNSGSLKVGMFVTIAGVAGLKRIVGKSGLNLTLDAAANASVSGAAVAYQAPVLKAFGVIAA
jgi:hypothetical protein